MRISGKNILRLLGYIFLVLIACLLVLVIIFHIRIRQRAELARSQRTDAQALRNAALAKHEQERRNQAFEFAPKPANPQNLGMYEGQYVWVGGDCDGWLKALPVFLLGPESLFSLVGKDWRLVQTDWFDMKAYEKVTVKGQKLRRVEKKVYDNKAVALVFNRTAENWEIDFSRFPEITAKDLLKRTECRFKCVESLVRPQES